MKLLEEIPTFPDPERRLLLSEYGIDTAEAFFANAIHGPGALATALHADRAEVDRLIRIVEGYLPAGYRERCQTPVRRPRGLITDP
jgi:hypothetical protein